MGTAPQRRNMPAAGTATGSYTKGDGTSVSFTVDNADVDAFSLTAANARTGTQPH